MCLMACKAYTCILFLILLKPCSLGIMIDHVSAKALSFRGHPSGTHQALGAWATAGCLRRGSTGDSGCHVIFGGVCSCVFVGYMCLEI